MSPSRPPSRGRPQGGGHKENFNFLMSPPASPHEGCRERCRSRPERCRSVAPELERLERHRSLPQRCRSRLPHVARDPPAHRTTSQHRSATHPATASDVARPSSDIARDVGGGRLRHRTPAERHRTSLKRYPGKYYATLKTRIVHKCLARGTCGQCVCCSSEARISKLKLS